MISSLLKPLFEPITEQVTGLISDVRQSIRSFSNQIGLFIVFNIVLMLVQTALLVMIVLKLFI